MPNHTATFTDANHKQLDKHLLKVLEAVRDGALSPSRAQGHLSQLLAAVGEGNYNESLASAANSAETIKIVARHS